MYAYFDPQFPLASLQPWCVMANPAYGGPFLAGKYYGRPLKRDAGTRDAKRGFHEALERDIQANGVRNPLCVWEIDGKLYLRYGQSRWEALRRLKIETAPAIISGPGSHPYFARLPDEPFEMIDLTDPTAAGFLKYFKDQPRKWKITEEGYLDFVRCLGEFEVQIGRQT
jgi:hypothetical protein